jgi:hypothetical protein
MNRFFLILAAFAPIFASPLIGGLPTNPAQRVVYIEQYLYLLVVLATWNMTLIACEFFLRKKISGLSFKALLSALPLFLFLLLALSGLQLFRLHFGSGAFYLLIASLTLQSSSIALFKRKRELLAVTVLGLNSWLIGYMTFNVWGLHINWQALLFTAGLAGQITSVRMSRIFQGDSATLVRYTENVVSKDNLATTIGASIAPYKLRLYLIMLLSGFLSVALLVLFGQLPYGYFSIYALLPPIAFLANKVRGAGFSHDLAGLKSGRVLVAFILVVLVTTVLNY